jgi:serine/threonine protein kinase/Tol biopolymer transport system component
MPLIPGARLGPYEIVAAIGAGGMGEVYRGRDTRLDRAIAIKILPPQFAGDPELRARFDREARAVSSLNHPHICALYDIGCDSGTDYLVLELLDGETLAARLARTGALPPHDALQIAIEICGALDRAHRAGIVHRDLKPANVMLTKAGAKLLDFGLAKTAAPVVAISGLSMMPTTPHGVTQQGAILGTFQYMAPEQIEGLEADARTDIFAFAALLFEMLTGRPAFEGKTRASLLGAILKDQPPRVSAVQPLAPKTLDRIVAACLAKDPDDRYQSARDLLRDLQWIASAAAIDAPPAVAPSRGRHISRTGWALVAAASLAIAAAGMLVGSIRRAPDPAEVTQFLIAPPEGTEFGGPSGGGTGTAPQLTISPDGRNIVFSAGTRSSYQLWIRPLGVMTARPIPGTEQGTFPFWSPDSRFLAFFSNGKLKKINPAGGPATVLCDASPMGGGTWNRDNVIIFTPATRGTGLFRVSSAGGTPTAVTTLDPTTGETNHRWPYFLPDGRHFLYTAVSGTCCPAPNPAVIRIASIDPSEATTTLLRGYETAASYASGHVLFATGDDTLMAQPFDVRTRQMNGDAFPLAERVSTEGSRYAAASASMTGVLVYGRGGSRSSTRLTWFSRTGAILTTVADPAAYLGLALSPDDRRIAVALGTGAPENRDIWNIDVSRGIRSRVTSDPAPDLSPVWSPDGLRVAFGTQRSGRYSLRLRPVTGTADDDVLFEGAGGFDILAPSSWSSDGRYLAFTRGAGSQADIWVLPLFGDRKAFAVAHTRFSETSAAFSPDGRWIAYASDERGTRDVYVEPFPPNGDRHLVSQSSAGEPLWRHDGKELFFLRQDDGTLMAAAVDATRGFETVATQTLFQPNAARYNTGLGNYAVSRDGQRFLVNSRREQSSGVPLTVVVNWLAAVQK